MIIIPGERRDRAVPRPINVPVRVLLEMEIACADDLVERMEQGGYLSLGTALVGRSIPYLIEDHAEGLRLYTMIPAETIERLINDGRIKVRRNGKFRYGELTDAKRV